MSTSPIFDALVTEYDYPANEFPFQYEYPYVEGAGLIMVALQRPDGTFRRAYRGTGVRLPAPSKPNLC